MPPSLEPTGPVPPRRLAALVVALIALQVATIVGGNVRMMPLTGVTLPFVSYGGSSMLTSWLMIGLLLRASHEEAVSPARG